MDEQTSWQQKRRAASFSLATNVFLTALKIAAAVLTGSISLFSEAIHSATDIAASAIAFASVRAASVPPDDEHPFGHGKIESLAGFGESILLGGIVVYILVESVPRLFHPGDIRFPVPGIIVMAVSSVACLAVGRYVLNVAKVTESTALQSNGTHLTIDCFTSLGVLAALLITHYTGWRIADPLLACLLAVWIAVNAWRTCHIAFDELIDQRISDEDLQKIKSILEEEERILSYHKLLTRHSGSRHFVELHVVVPSTFTVVEGHDVADGIEKRISTALAPAHVVIHVDPLEPSKVTE